MKYFQTIFLAFIVMLLSGCSVTSKEPISKTGFYFDTVITITIYDSDNEDLLEQCFSYCDAFEKQISRTIETSEISLINAAKGNPVKVSEETIEILKGVRDKYEAHHNIKITDEAINAATELSERYILTIVFCPTRL